MGSTAQIDSVGYYLQPPPSESRKQVLKLLKTERHALKAKEVEQLLAQKIQLLQAEGYLLAKLDSSFCMPPICTLFIDAGKRYYWTQLENGNIPEALLDAINYQSSTSKRKVFRYAEVYALQQKILTYCENHAYPFAQTWLDSLNIKNDSLVLAKLYLDYGPKITIDSIDIRQKNNTKKKVQISKFYLQKYLDLEYGNPYDERQIQKIKKRLKELPFLSLSQDPYILFKEKKAQAVLFLESRNASKFDILFGLLPNTNALPQEPPFKFTGNIQIDLLNPFGTGKRILIHWQQYEQGRSEIQLAFSYPYILKTPLGIDAKFNIYRRDSTYIDIISDIGIQYLFDGNNYLKAFWKNTRTNLLQIDTNYVLRNRKLPPLQDLNNATFGLEYFMQRLDYRWNPRKGFRLKLNAGVGIKNIRKNNTILSLTDPSDPDFNFAQLYNDANRQSFQYDFQLHYAYFFPTSSRSTLMSRYQAAWLYSSNQQLYSNELYRIGGSQLMRGFDEQSILASWYNIFSLEWRYLIGQNSYAYAFSDGGYWEIDQTQENQSAWLYGIGVGAALETSVGIFGLSYALGSRLNEPIIFRNGKIHFGYVNIF